MHSLCNDDVISVYVCPELIAEFKRIAASEKIRKYTTEERTKQTLKLIENSCITIFVKNTAVSPNLRDAKDLYLLSLAETVVADYILTGDNDLLALQAHHQTKIITYNDFIQLTS
jgi:putative PIN family toxin of toxin-antitoxin system